MDRRGEVAELEVRAEGERLSRRRSYEEIYRRHAGRYDELVAHEDYRGRLGATLDEIAVWEGASVVEAGIGTGRVTAHYVERVGEAALFDRSAHMLAFARRRFAGYPVSFAQAEHLDIRGVRGDIFIEGWAFGHHIVSNAARLRSAARELEGVVRRAVRSGGTAIIIETLGTNTEKIRVPHPALAGWYRMLEGEFGYTRRAIRTDYKFASAREAARIMGFFFGPAMEKRIERKRATIIPEWTGVWWRTSKSLYAREGSSGNSRHVWE